MDTYGRAQEIIQELDALGTRATMDVATASPPCILVTPPNLTFDLQCADAVTAQWQMVALAPSASTADRTTWQALEGLVNSLNKVIDIESGIVVAYVLNGRTYPAYLLTCTEGI